MAEWRKAANIDGAVEVCFREDAVLVRESSNPNGPTLSFTLTEWEAFVAGAKDGEFDL